MTVTSISSLLNLNLKQDLSNGIRKTSLIVTIGPKTNSVEMITNLRKAGASIFRLNFSHGSYEYHQSVIDNCRESERIYTHRPLAIALDTKGPEIRTGKTLDDLEYPIPSGHKMIFTTNEDYENKCNDKILYIDYKNIHKVIEIGKLIYLDDGNIAFKVIEKVDNQNLKVVAENAGVICSHKGVNLPGTSIDLPSFSKKDVEDIKFGIKNKVDMIFASFIRSGDDVKKIRDLLGVENKHIQIISKIENEQGMQNFDSILKETNGVMVARGDLGVEVLLSKVFLYQKHLISKCNLHAKPVVCATQMLESMTFNPRPTRAEVTDVGNAILDGADCIMLSGETAKGKFPVETVLIMNKIAVTAESAVAYNQVYEDLRNLTPKPTSTLETCAIATVAAVFEQHAKGIIVLSTSGASARLLSKYKPPVPILMITRNLNAAKYSLLYRSVYPFIYTESRHKIWQEDVDERFKWGIEKGIAFNFFQKGDSVIMVQGFEKGSGNSNTIKITTI